MKKNEITPEITHPVTNENQPSSNGLAVTSLVLGILSFTGPGLILGIPAIIFGIIALRKSNTDRGLSWGGIITGAISTALSLLALLAFVIFFIIVVMAGASADPSFDSRNYDGEQAVESAYIAPALRA